jgi:hypothetical protein
MAKSSNGGGGADSWPGFLSELNKNFLILRDVFGYALPGGVFLSIGVLCRRFSLRDVKYLLDPYQLPAWLALLIGLGACYAVGHVMAGIAYLICNNWGNPRKKIEISAIPAVEKSGPTQVPASLIDIRGRHPELLTELDRQSTMTQLRGSTGVAMLLGSLLFYRFSTPSLGWMLGLAGLFLLIVFLFSAIPNVIDLTTRTVQAGTLADKADKATEAIDPTKLKQVLEGFISAAQEALTKLG